LEGSEWSALVLLGMHEKLLARLHPTYKERSQLSTGSGTGSSRQGKDTMGREENGGKGKRWREGNLTKFPTGISSFPLPALALSHNDWQTICDASLEASSVMTYKPSKLR